MSFIACRFVVISDDKLQSHLFRGPDLSNNYWVVGHKFGKGCSSTSQSKIINSFIVPQSVQAPTTGRSNHIRPLVLAEFKSVPLGRDGSSRCPLNLLVGHSKPFERKGEEAKKTNYTPAFAKGNPPASVTSCNLPKTEISRNEPTRFATGSEVLFCSDKICIS